MHALEGDTLTQKQHGCHEGARRHRGEIHPVEESLQDFLGGNHVGDGGTQLRFDRGGQLGHRGGAIVLFVHRSPGTLELLVEILDPLFVRILLVREQHALRNLGRGGGRRVELLYFAGLPPRAELLADRLLDGTEEFQHLALHLQRRGEAIKRRSEIWHQTNSSHAASRRSWIPRGL